ncbi:MAG: methylenetetrahydrofolate--tRNA-(uracil(54)-C(5))-methyltransferase (FADH(2)-oxidizing) TrmFO [Deltaproteobacteria bacterium]|nr:methylenetetrahydrofolate--tRNA-(uracil(54)-C(5))-methyltransferase (FADH(2)-oxidizing) TrmFO [Myxococcales bacterium]MCZ6570470.1 methylenetetrahydrofolate--tRNA-(uracil(54)-C(5))-methyltransferase (FADH(2)-oxidizing) TrmFO [Deltaproteobacteria bacterium]MCZ6822948.1 methylenetetrahydrofolate--tRNA-(uracil(54)-C(5))-methyltransferase (FADH(2)-oxidizing) TrmFO [Deltaproteobacteria bacterium]TDI97665.1 MAG: methylenetetrahydrofolate--tRNA-(uracil(54)-C(5))-methyltransferase (FADH(2)-oxidizing)
MGTPVTVIGGGLAGCEAAWQLARRGVPVRLFEMKPKRFSPAHSSEFMAELVCSNSLRSDQIHNAVGLLHEEMRRLGSLVLWAADRHRVPAGNALAVDRELFARSISERVAAQPEIEIVNQEVTSLPEGLAIVATGPLTSEKLADSIQGLCGDALYFYDSIAPTVYADSLDMQKIFRASRWEDADAGGDYLNIPLSREEYYAFVDEVARAEKMPLHRFEAAHYFEGCLPIEVMAQRGPDTLSFGPMKPVGLRDPRTGTTAFAVVQLRQEDKLGTLYNLVGFQTRMRIGEQKRILRSLPGMGKAVFARFGSVHRNTFIRSPSLLSSHLEHRQRPGLYFAGQIVGVEGYVESAALGLLAGVHVAFRVRDALAPLPPPTTAHGALLRYLAEASPKHFQPMNINYGLLPPLVKGDRRTPKRERNLQLSARALRELKAYAEAVLPTTA